MRLDLPPRRLRPGSSSSRARKARGGALLDSLREHEAYDLQQMRKRPVARASGKPKRDALDEALARVRRERTDIVFREAKGKKPYAVLVPVDDEETVEAIEDVIDARAAERAVAEMTGKGEKPIPYEQVRKQLGLA